MSSKGSRQRRAEQSLDLLREALNGYAYQHLSRADQARWSAVFNDEGDEQAFCSLFSAKYIVKYLDEFLGYFLIRKVIMANSRDGASRLATTPGLELSVDSGSRRSS